MKKTAWLLSFCALALFFASTPSDISGQVVHCESGALGCAVDHSQSNPNSCAACPDPNNINSCCAQQPAASCASIICDPAATATPPTTPAPPTATPPDAGSCTPIGNPANCSSANGCFSCQYNFGENTCTASISTGYQCNNNFGHDDSICAQFDGDPDGCQSCGTNILCVQQNPAVGYKCDSTTFGCFPCFSGDTSSGCDPPEYSDVDSCEDACSGNAQTLFSCVDGQCVESQNGVPISQCLSTCNSPPNSPLNDGDCAGNSLHTAIGCIPITGGDAFIGFILGWAIGIAGGIALLLIIYAGIQIMTAGGNPQKVQAGKELLTAAIGGFLFLLLSAYLLQFIGVDILGIF